MTPPVKSIVVIPVFNHSRTLRDVVSRALKVHPKVMVVDDGSTDGGIETLRDLDVSMVRHNRNRGKGAAILSAMEEARNFGATHLITIDADGQHDPADLPLFVSEIERSPEAIVVGTRDFAGSAVPLSSRFGRRFSNFWFRVQTGLSIKDTQSGFRAYPLAVLGWLKLREKRYAFEVEVLVKAAWAGVPLREVDISVHYSEATRRLSHFRPFEDNFRLSLLNTRLTVRAMLPVSPRRFRPEPAGPCGIALLHPLRSLRSLLDMHGSPRQLAASATLGVFLGSLPLVACQTVSILAAASFLRLNRLVALSASQLCMPPFVPALCIETGYFVRHGKFLTEISFQTIGYQSPQRFLEWIIGSLILGPILAAAAGALIYVFSSLARSNIGDA
jgi:uncharacterized protein (DUF2062 family)